MQKNSTIDRRVLCPGGVTLVHTYVFQSTSICQYILLERLLIGQQNCHKLYGLFNREIAS
jgi:hypothetical protein